MSSKLVKVIPVTEEEVVQGSVKLEEEKEKTKPESLKSDMKTVNWAWVAAAVILIALFFIFTSPGSKLKLGKDGIEAEQGTGKDAESSPKPAAVATATIIGSVNFKTPIFGAEDVLWVYTPDITTVPKARLGSDSRFKLIRVQVPPNRLLSIAIDLRNKQKPSVNCALPDPDSNGVIDVGELLIDLKPAPANQRKSGRRSSPVIIINNQNIQKN